jgi:hypothetical protein
VNYVADFRGRLGAFNLYACSLAAFGASGWNNFTQSGDRFSIWEPEGGRKAFHRRRTIQSPIGGNSVKLAHFLTQFHIHRSDDKKRNRCNGLLDQLVAREAGMAELADAADSKSAGT